MELSSRSKRQLKVAIWGTVLVMCFYLFVVALPHLMFLGGYKTFRIPSGSMRPNILENEYILTKKISNIEDLQAGDVVVFSFSAWKALDFQAEENPDCVITLNQRDLVKRVIAKSHDIIEFGEDGIMVNGITISEESNLNGLEILNSGIRYPIIPPVKYKKLITQINSGNVFVLGDNRAKSADSRCWGEVPFTAIKGKVGRIWYSENEEGVRWSRLGKKVK